MPGFLNKGTGSTPLSSSCRQKLEIDDAKTDKCLVLLCPDSQSCHKIGLLALTPIASGRPEREFHMHSLT